MLPRPINTDLYVESNVKVIKYFGFDLYTHTYGRNQWYMFATLRSTSQCLEKDP